LGLWPCCEKSISLSISPATGILQHGL